MYSHKREESYKGNKRERPEYGSSPEDENRIFQKSKVLTRTPPEKVETDKEEEIGIGIWNINTLTGKDVEIIEEMESNNIDILGVSETKKKGRGQKLKD
ncbi:hypothetical protein QE152_g22190 [Popillia japonica]|uniref:Endonuclease/exonuclease/phosphatase n=1 Tax=Popillia japonica TaxID=7064 RepID=A0AAW1KLX8_POPJA